MKANTHIGMRTRGSSPIKVKSETTLMMYNLQKVQHKEIRFHTQSSHLQSTTTIEIFFSTGRSLYEINVQSTVSS